MSMRIQPPLPPPREVPRTNGFTTPLLKNFVYAQHLVVTACAAAEASEASRAVIRAVEHESHEVRTAEDRLADTHQFSIVRSGVMTIDAALVVYSAMWVGEAAYMEHLHRLSAVERLKRLAEYCAARMLDDTDEIVRLARSTVAKRDSHLLAERSSVKSINRTPRVAAVAESDRAEDIGFAAARELHRFLGLFAQLDGRTGEYFLPLLSWPMQATAPAPVRQRRTLTRYEQ